MSKIRLHGTSSGYTDIAPTAAAGNNILTAPTGTGTIVIKDGSGAIGITSVQATNANFSGTTRITSGISTTLRITTGISTTLQVGGVNVLNSDGVNTTGIVTAATFVPTVGQLGNRNIIINGAMQVAQYGTTKSGEGYTCDRWRWLRNGHDEEPTLTQQSLSTSDTGPYGAGFRNSLKLQNGNQSGGADAADYALIRYSIEAQNIANSGWNYKSATSYITLSYWVKSSVAQNFYVNIQSKDGTSQSYPFETGSLTADTWTKITKTIPGLANGNIDINDDNGSGLVMDIWPFAGTSYTSSGVTLNAWAAYSSAARFADNTSTWWTTNDSTFEITGVQLEVGSVATPFEHRSYGEELARCQRYYEEGAFSTRASGSIVRYFQSFNTTKRANPTVDVYYDVNKATSGTINSGNSNNSGWNESGMMSGWNMEKNTGSNGDGVDYAGWYTASAEL